jgi:hypothetical protein
MIGYRGASRTDFTILPPIFKIEPIYAFHIVYLSHAWKKLFLEEPTHVDRSVQYCR